MCPISALAPQHRRRGFGSALGKLLGGLWTAQRNAGKKDEICRMKKSDV
jgi:hypothetical protein